MSSSDSTSYSSYNNYGKRCLFPFIFRCFLYCNSVLLPFLAPPSIKTKETFPAVVAVLFPSID